MMHLYSALSISKCFTVLCNTLQSCVISGATAKTCEKIKFLPYKILNRFKYLHIIQQAAGKLCALAISVQSFSKLSFPVVL